MERTTNAFGRIPCEMLRLLMLPSKGLMVLETFSLALRHVDYGAQREHNEVFERSFLRALSQFLIREGGVWDAEVSDGWSWVYSTFSDELLSALEVVKPKVEAVRSSWNQIITKSVMQSEFSDDSHASGTTHMSSRRHSVSGRTIASIHGTGGMLSRRSSHKSHQKRSTLNAEMSNEDGVDGRQRALVSVGAAMARRLQVRNTELEHSETFQSQAARKRCIHGIGSRISRYSAYPHCANVHAYIRAYVRA
ncbi:fadA [Symbiodinium sp. CCMP2592]|nr:fadA [Symbiodinium sp. CCMP2592]